MAYGTAAAGAALAQAIKASGAIVRVAPRDFLAIVSRGTAPLVVTAIGGLFRKNYRYLAAYKALVFFTKSPEPLQLPGDAEVVAAEKIWIPS